MGAASKRAKRERVSTEFELERISQRPIAPMLQTSGFYAWDLAAIRDARAAQLAGRFRLAARLAEQMRTDSAIFTALENRLAPLRGLPVALEAPRETALAARMLDEAEGLFGAQGVGVSTETCADMNAALAVHGLAVGFNVHTVRSNASRVDVQLCAWPMEHVRCDPLNPGEYLARLADGTEEPIVHGDGRWVVARSHELEPHKWGALLPLALVWADRAYGVRDRAKSSTSHGNAKVVGTLPAGLSIKSPEGIAFLEFLRTMHGEQPVGIKPHGSTVEYLTNSSRSWEIFREIINSNESSAAKILLGQDGTTNNSGGNYIKSDVLFGVRNDIVEGDLRALERAILTGTIEPWAAINFSSSLLAPRRRWLLPDPDEDARRDSLAKRTDAFNKSIAEHRTNGFVVDQALADRLAESFGVIAPRLADAAPTGAELFQYDLELGIVTVDEARARKGLPPLPNGAGQVTVPQQRAAEAAAAAARAPAPTDPAAA